MLQRRLIRATQNRRREQTDGAGDAIAVFAQVGPGRVAARRKVYSNPVEQVESRLNRNVELEAGVRERDRDRIARVVQLILPRLKTIFDFLERTRASLINNVIGHAAISVGGMDCIPAAARQAQTRR